MVNLGDFLGHDSLVAPYIFHKFEEKKFDECPLPVRSTDGTEGGGMQIIEEGGPEMRHGGNVKGARL